ncbi:MAG: hypothetical protein PUD24_01825 [Oscillospiraceae bacterium]|nr:hypothetical protein [Oscillospiraceae bacterium]
MKKLVLIIFLFALLFGISCINADALESPQESAPFEIISNTDKQNLYNSLSDEAKKSLSNLGIDGIDYNSINDLTFEKIISEIISAAANQSANPLKAFISIIAVMLLSSMLGTLKSSLENSRMQQIIDVVATLCITSALVVPVSNTVLHTTEIIVTASNFMLAYIPIMLVVMVSSGQAVSGSAYYSMMIMAGQGVSQIASNVIAPLLNAFLGISIAAAVSPNMNLSGITSFIGKIIKWLLGFVMTIFTALLSFKQIITTSLDNVSTRAVRFTLTSLVPVVGSALSDAYKTVQSSVNLLKSGLGVFVIISTAVVFLPVIAECLLWVLSIGLSKAAGEVLNFSQPCKVLEAVSTVVTTLLAIIFCIMAVYIISTAVVLMMGGAKS